MRTKLHKALLAKGPNYVPRARHKNADGTPKYTNRLILEQSPYLLQHAHNPVDWFPWGEAAFLRARTLHRPIFLSIGYSTCHWCHVMEEESFEDEEIARYLNEHYVAIKVDREERPDIDGVYMSFVQAFTGNGGWPMSVWLTPSLDPFFGGTYFPPRAGARGAKVGFMDILREQAHRFADQATGVAAEAQGVSRQLQKANSPQSIGDLPNAVILKSARDEAARRFDPVMGGPRGAPKFPSSFPVRLLLRVARRSGDTEARTMASETLDYMRAGGIYDQVGGGFHRYATDPLWLVPHFEKMLYDNAQLATDYLEAAKATGQARYLRTVRETLDYLLRDMQAPDGTFYSATDADSPTSSGRREEGAFFTWTPAELREALGADDAKLAQVWFGVTSQGQLDGRSILHTERPLPEVAREFGQTPANLEARLADIRLRMLARRSRRPSPVRDEKSIVAWNGLAISAFARTAIALGDARYADAAIRAARTLIAPFIQHHELPHEWIAGRPVDRAFSDDYVFLASSLIDVFELTDDPSWLDTAIALMDEVERSFADKTSGGYFLTAAHHQQLILRERPDYDGPVPSVNSIAALTWLRLYTLTTEDRYRLRAERTMRAFSHKLTESPLALDQMLLALDWATDAAKEIVIVVPEGRGALAAKARTLLDVYANHFVPNAVLVVATAADLDGDIAKYIPWAKNKTMQAGQPTAYVCEQGTCKLPTSSAVVFAKQLGEARPYP